MDPEVIDAREGSQPHPCRGMWDYRGLNAGGHEIYVCEDGESRTPAHVLIAAHVNADHVCTDGLCEITRGRGTPT